MNAEHIVKHESFILITKLKQLGLKLDLTPDKLSRYILRKIIK